MERPDEESAFIEKDLNEEVKEIGLYQFWTWGSCFCVLLLVFLSGTFLQSAASRSPNHVNSYVVPSHTPNLDVSSNGSESKPITINLPRVPPNASISIGNKNVTPRYKTVADFKAISDVIREVPIEIVKEFYFTIGPEAMLRVVSEHNYCHSEAHNIGKAVFYFHNQSFSESIPICLSICNAGCFHGVLLQYFYLLSGNKGLFDSNLFQNYYLLTTNRSNGNATASSSTQLPLPNIKLNIRPADFNRVCDSPQIRQLYGLENCYHGVGHVISGMMAVKDIGKAISICKSLGDQFKVYGCATGAYMEVIFTLAQLERNGKLKAANQHLPMLWPCNLSNDYPAGCYRYISNKFVMMSLQKRQRLCLEMKNANQRRGCFHGLGYKSTLYEVANFGLGNSNSNSNNIAAITVVSPINATSIIGGAATASSPTHLPFSLKSLCSVGDRLDRIMCVVGGVLWVIPDIKDRPPNINDGKNNNSSAADGGGGIDIAVKLDSLRLDSGVAQRYKLSQFCDVFRETSNSNINNQEEKEEVVSVSDEELYNVCMEPKGSIYKRFSDFFFVTEESDPIRKGADGLKKGDRE